MINNLKGMYCYLVGSVDKANDLGSGWREGLTPLLKNFGLNVINPLKKPVIDGEEKDIDQRSYRGKLKKEGKYDEFSKIMKRVRAVDLRFVDKSDFLIVNLNLDIPACGTYEEICIANRQRKPVIIMCPQGKEEIPDWMFGQLPHELFFNSWGSVFDYLYKLDMSENPDTMKDRWLFFNRKENL